MRGESRAEQAAAKHLSPEEAAIIADLERHRMQVSQLHDILCGGYVLVDNPQLYDDWRLNKISHERMSSRHRAIDKSRYPDIGMRGHVVREKLHGRTEQGTWVQLEKTPAAFGKSKLPASTMLRHLVNYVVYKITCATPLPACSRPKHHRCEPGRTSLRTSAQRRLPYCRQPDNP